MISQRHIIAADLASPRMVGSVVVVTAESRQLSLPPDLARIDINATEHVWAFDKEPAARNLR